MSTDEPQWPTHRALDFDLDEMVTSLVDPIFGRPMYFDRQGNPITLLQWGGFRYDGLDADDSFGDESYVRVASDVVGDTSVSTVWLGIDHSIGVGPPLIFETMLFGGDHDGMQMRYTTEAEAAAGHQEAVDDLRAGMQPWWAHGGIGDDSFHWSPNE